MTSSSSSSPSLSFLFSLSLLWGFLISPSQSLTCTSDKFTNSELYTNCTDLPTLNSTLHFTYNAANSSLNIAFIATPPDSDGWVSWAVNPTAEGMAGSQAFVAFKSNGSLVVKTYNLASYRSVNESKLSFDNWDLKAEYANGVDGSIVIFASLKVPGGSDKLNQVWNVGPVANGTIGRHGKEDANNNAHSVLELVSSDAVDSPAATPGAGNNGTPPAAPSSGVLKKSNVGFVMGLVSIVSCIMWF